MSAPSLETLIDLAHRTADFWSAQGYEEYLGSVTIDCGLQPRRFRDVANDWQWDRSLEICPALEQLAGLRQNYHGPLNFWWEFSKGHDKTTSTAREMNWLLAYSRRPLVMYACGGDRDQAALIRLAMEKELELNPWLKARVEVSGYHAKGLQNGSSLEILAADAATAQGKFPDYIAFEEVCSWKHQSGREFWDAMYSSRNKKPHCIAKINTNAGFKGTWQHEVKKLIVTSARWAVRTQPERTTIATWMSPAAIAEDRKLLLPAEAKRVLDNIWVDPGEENGYLTLEEAETCVDPNLTERTSGEPGTYYWFSFDYGGVHDRSAGAVMHAVRGTDEVVVDRLDVWVGTHQSPVQIATVDAWIEKQIANFGGRGHGIIQGIVLDRYQLEGSIQKFGRQYHVEAFDYDGGKANQRMAERFRQHVQSKKVRWSPTAGLISGVEDDTLAKEIAGLVLKTTSYGYRFDHKTSGFSDRVVTVGMGLLHCLENLPPATDTTPILLNTPRTDPIQRMQQMDHAARPGIVSPFGIGGMGGTMTGNPFGGA